MNCPNYTTPESLKTMHDVPLSKFSEHTLIVAIPAGPLTDEVQRFADEMMVDLLKCMLTYDPQQKCTTEQTLQHELFKIQRAGGGER